MIRNKKQMFALIGAFILTIVLGTVTFAFFNYTRTGSANVIKTGRISFNSTQGNTINLTNMFPIEANETNLADSTKVGTVTINVTGDTTYTEGIEYLVTATNVQNTVGNKALPISIDVSYSANTNKTIGTEDEEYFDNRGGNTSLYRILAKDTITNNKKLVVGYIKPDQTGIDGNIVIKAYLDKAKVAISDTYPEEETDTNNDGYIDGTPTSFGTGKTIFTTTEWNSLQQNGVSFQVKVEANEGIWVEEIRSVNVMNTFPAVITDEKESIKEVYFNKMGATRMQQAYEGATIKADLTYNDEGKVLAWLEVNENDNTKYNLIVASNGDTYLPSESNLMFSGFSNVTTIEFGNINTSNVTKLTAMFSGCSSLTSLDLSMFDTKNVDDMSAIFIGCSSLLNVNLENLGGSKLNSATALFYDCNSLININMSGFNFGNVSNLANSLSGSNSLNNLETFDLSNAGGDNLTTVFGMFNNCYNIETIDMSGFNFGNVTQLNELFSNLSNLSNLNLTNVDTSNITEMKLMFNGCTSLTVLDLSSFDTSNLSSGNYGAYNMFKDCTSLEKIYISNTWDMSNQSSNMSIFDGCTSLVGGAGTTYDPNHIDKEYAKIDGGQNDPGYLTLKTN